MIRPTPEDAEAWLRAHRHGTAAATALEFLDSLPGVPVPAMTGRWLGAGWHTGHPWDGLLEAYGWWGKEVVDADTVRPLLVRDGGGDPVPVSPAVAPVTALGAWPRLFRSPPAAAVFRLALPLLRSGRPGGRLRVVVHRGTPTAGLLYDRVPIVDAFRRVTDDLVVGAADIRGQEAPLLFVLRRARAVERARSVCEQAPSLGEEPPVPDVVPPPAGVPAEAAATPDDDPPPADDDPPPADEPPGDDAPRAEDPPADDPPPEVAKFLVRGTLTVLPRRREDRDRVLRWIASRTLPLLEPVTERDLTDRLARGTRDPVGLRRGLVDAGIVSRTRDGAEYWRTRVTEFDPY